jgi:hypothetical protein
MQKIINRERILLFVLLRKIRKNFEDVEFKNDIFSVIRPDIEYDNVVAWEKVKKELKIII